MPKKFLLAFPKTLRWQTIWLGLLTLGYRCCTLSIYLGYRRHSHRFVEVNSTQVENTHKEIHFTLLVITIKKTKLQTFCFFFMSQVQPDILLKVINNPYRNSPFTLFSSSDYDFEKNQKVGHYAIDFKK